MIPTLDRSDFYPKFRVGRFLKFFIYHTLFYFFGFLSVPIMIAIDGYDLPYNIGYIGLQKNLITQLLSHLLLLVCLITFFISESSVLYKYELFFMLMSVILRNLVIGVKYGFLSDERYFLLKNTRFSRVIIEGDFIVYAFRKYNPDGVKKEVESSMYRSFIDESLFTMTV